MGEEETMSDEHNGHGQSRLDRLEGLMQLLIDDHLKFRDEHRQLLTSQVLLTDAQQRTEQNMQALAESQKHTDERLSALIKLIKELAESQMHTDERLNALIQVVDDLVRNPPPQPPQ